MNHRSRKSKIHLASSTVLTDKEIALLSRQIRYNSQAIDRFIRVIDLLVNKEKCPKDANTLLALRVRMSVAINENDTFRKVIWRHKKALDKTTNESLDAASFLISCIKIRNQALIAQAARK